MKMLTIHKIENCYGLQNCKRVINTSFIRTSTSNSSIHQDINMIYGVNMSGKSSLVKVFKKLKNEENIDNRLNIDGDPTVDISINDCRVIYKSNKWTYPEKFKDSLFIYDKQFVNENYTIIEKVGYVGKNADLYYELLDRQKKLKIKSTDIRKTVQKITLINNKSDFKGFGSSLKFSNLFSNGDTPFNTLVELAEKTSSLTKFSISEEAYQKNYKLLMHDKIDLTIIDKLLDQIDSFSSRLKSKYNIQTPDNLSFYQMIKEYLMNNEIEECPICLRDFDVNNNKMDIIHQIETEIKAFTSNEAFNSVLNILAQYNDIDSEYIKDFRHVIFRLTGDNGVVSNEEIFQLKQKITSFYNEVDDYLFSRVIGIYSNEIMKYIDTRDKVRLIYNQNKKITDSTLLNTFNELLTISQFPLQNIIEATLDENEPFIRISIKNSNSSLKDYFIFNASEGEKSLLSILYYFALVRNSTIKHEDKICIIDDPIDSHNNQNKYLVMRFIIEQLSIDKLFNIILTHSADVIKFSRNFAKKNTKIYLLTEEHKNGLFELDNKHYKVFDGLFDFFKEAVINRSTDNVAFKAVSLMTILRDYINQTKIFSDSVICTTASGDSINLSLYRELSNRAIHFNDSNDYMTIEDLVKIYTNVIKGFTKPKSTLGDYNRVKNTKINDYIEKRFQYKDYQIENLTMNIMQKNLWALYIRTSMEKIVYDFSIKSLPTNKKINSFIADFNSPNYYQLGAKISMVESSYRKNFDSKSLLKWKAIYDTVNILKPIINDFHHLVNSYVTPMFEIKLSELEEYNKMLVNLKKECL